MNRLQKKCLIASTGLHGFLLLLVLFGSAFFVAKEKPINTPKLRFVPSRFVEDALAGGGGNPKIAQTDDVQKGSLQAPAQVTPAPAPPPPAPKQEVKKAEPKKPDPPAPTPKPVKPVEVAQPKPAEKAPPPKPRIDLSDLKPISNAEKRKAQQEAEAQEAARQRALAAAAATAAANATRQKLAQQIGKATETMQRGFSSGTKVDVWGPGGEAYASYGALVQQIYADAWTVLQDMTDDDSVAVVRVTIARDGRVLEARFVRRSDSATMNKSVQRALDSVKQIGRPFPDFIKDLERSFTIEFNLKAKKLLG